MPDAGGTAFRRRRVWEVAVRRLLVLLLVAAVGAFVLRGGVPCEVLEVQPDCYVTLMPGPVEDATTLVEIDGEPAYAPTGELLLTTVAVDEELGLSDWLAAVFHDVREAVPRSTVFPAGSDREEVTRQNAALMAESQRAATVAALRAHGVEVEESVTGARVEERLTDAARRALDPGDVIEAVDGEATPGSAAVAEAVAARTPGETVTLTVRRDDERRRVEVELASTRDAAREPLLGVRLSDHRDLPVDVTIDAGVIGGPSAGLMFALSILELLGPEELTGGAVVAGTGTLAADGTVGVVGGVRQKVAAVAEPREGRRPASVFLVPEGNLAQVAGLSVPRELLLVPVATLDDALEAVSAVRAGRRPAGALALERRD